MEVPMEVWKCRWKYGSADGRWKCVLREGWDGPFRPPYMFTYCVCKTFVLSRCSIVWQCSIFGRGKLCFCVRIVCATFVLSRCSIFPQLPVKMFHLWARGVVFVCVMCVQLSCCQDVPSFGSFLSRCSIFGRGSCVSVCVLCVQLSCCQDVPSFGSFPSRCSIFGRGELFLCA